MSAMTDDQYKRLAESEAALLPWHTAELGFAEILAEYLNVTLELDDEDDDDYPVETQQVLDLAQDLTNKLDMLGLDLVWKDEGARLLAEGGTYAS